MPRPSTVGSAEPGPDPAELWRAGKHKLSREERAEGLLPARDFGGSRFVFTSALQEGAASLLDTGGDWCHLQRPIWRAFCVASNCCPKLPARDQACPSRGCPGPRSALILCALLRDPGWTEGGVRPMEAAPGWHGSDVHGGPPSQMPRPASPPRAESRTQIPSLTSGPVPGPLAVPGSPPDGSAAPPQRPRFGVTRQGPSEEETHLYNKSTNGFLAHDLFLRYLSGMLKVGLKQHVIYQEASLRPEERKNSQDGSEVTLPTAHAAGE